MTSSTSLAAGTKTSAAEPREYSHREILQVMTGLLAALFTALISTTIVSTALPTLMADLHGTQREYTWVITASLLAITIVTPIWGKLSDLFSRRIRTYLPHRSTDRCRLGGGNRHSERHSPAHHSVHETWRPAR